MDRQGQLIQLDFFDSVGGINLADSPMRVKDSQSTGGFNFDYALTGGFKKRFGHAKMNSVADSSLRTLGLGLRNTSLGVKTVIRAADLVFQAVDSDTQVFTPLTTDTAAAVSNVLTAGSTTTISFEEFNAGDNSILWATGGGLTLPYGVYSETKITQNGVAAPTGVVGATVNTSAGGTWIAPGVFTYAVAFRKRSTQATSNVALDVTATVVNTGDTVTLDLSTITNIETTLYDKFVIYRSAVSGGTGFTTGDVVARVDITATNYIDTGTSLASSQNVPRSGNIILDNSTLPAGTCNSLTTFKRRLVTAQASTIYLSDLNKPESWPATNTITIPSGGPITAMGVISFTSPQAQTLDELLVIFKERELWVVTGTDYTDWSLKFIDEVGCVSDNLLVIANGYLAWIDFRGVYLWDGAGKPIYVSRLLEPLFAKDGDLEKALLSLGVAQFYRKSNQIIWYLSHKLCGEQQYALKLDLRLTLPSIDQTMTGRILDGVFAQDKCAVPFYSVLSYLPAATSEEKIIMGDASGFLYNGYSAFADAGGNFSFTYATKFIDCGSPGTDKRFHKVVLWVNEVGTWPVYCDYWSKYMQAESVKSTKATPISSAVNTVTALWDIAFWDEAFWDDYLPRLVPLVFNLDAGLQNANEGDSIRIQFRNDTADQPVVAAGFSLIFSTKGLAK